MDKEVSKENEEYISSIVKPILNKILAQEMPKNPLSVGGSVGSVKKYCLYQPHNYRIYLDFKRDNFNIKPFQENKKETIGVVYRLINKTECEVRNFKNCRIVIKKTQAEITNLIDHKRWYRIGISQKAKQQIKEIIIKKDNECISALKGLITILGGKSDFHILNRHSEDKVMKEDIIDLLPIKQKWHIPKIAKKVYNEHNVEFADPAFASNYITNRAIEEIAPEIYNGLKRIEIGLNGIVEVIKEQAKNVLALTEQVNLHIPAIEKLGTNTEKFSNEIIKLNLTLLEFKKPKKSLITKLKEYLKL